MPRRRGAALWVRRRRRSSEGDGRAATAKQAKPSQATPLHGPPTWISSRGMWLTVPHDCVCTWPPLARGSNTRDSPKSHTCAPTVARPGGREAGRQAHSGWWRVARGSAGAGAIEFSGAPTCVPVRYRQASGTSTSATSPAVPWPGSRGGPAAGRAGSPPAARCWQSGRHAARCSGRGGIAKVGWRASPPGNAARPHQTGKARSPTQQAAHLCWCRYCSAAAISCRGRESAGVAGSVRRRQ